MLALTWHTAPKETDGGEGEIKFFINGDTKFPTIADTGTQDYFCGSYGFDTKKKNVWPHTTDPVFREGS